MKNPLPIKNNSGRKPRRRGQAMVEFALVFPILIVTILALVEFGMYLKDALGVHFAELEATRTVAAQGTTTPDDSAALLVISNAGLLGLNFSQIYYVEVYSATSATDTTPWHGTCSGNSCTTPAEEDMMYSWQFSSTLNSYIWMVDSHGNNNWQPGLRNDVIPTSIFGVHIRYKHYWVDPLLHSMTGTNGYVDIDQRTIMPIEPACYSDDAAYCRAQH